MTPNQPASGVDIPGQRGQQTADHGHEIQGFGALERLESGSTEATHISSHALNRILADSIVLYDLYRKCQRIARGKGLDQLQQLLGQHAMQQLELIDTIIEHIEALGGMATTDPRRVVEVTSVSCPSDEDDELETLLRWLLDVHELICDKLFVAIDSSGDNSDCGNNPTLEDAFRRHRLQERVIAIICQEHERRAVDRHHQDTDWMEELQTRVAHDQPPAIGR